MSDQIRYSISVTPVETLTTENSTTEDVIASEVNKSLGGSGTAAVTSYGRDADVQGYKDAAVNYREAIDSADTTDISSESAATFLYIKNTGFAYSSATVLGAALSKAVKVMSGTTLLSVLDPGEPFGPLKDDNGGIDCTGIHVRTVDLDGSENASAGHLAVEFLAVK